MNFYEYFPSVEINVNVFSGLYASITQVIIFVIKNTRYLGSFSPRLV